MNISTLPAKNMLTVHIFMYIYKHKYAVCIYCLERNVSKVTHGCYRWLFSFARGSHMSTVLDMHGSRVFGGRAQHSRPLQSGSQMTRGRALMYFRPAHIHKKEQTFPPPPSATSICIIACHYVSLINSNVRHRHNQSKPFFDSVYKNWLVIINFKKNLWFILWCF